MDRSQLERELERLHTESWGWALACTRRDRVLAEEALQTAYVRIVSGQARFDGRSSVKSWVFGVIRYAALEELRRSTRAKARLVPPDGRPDIVDPAPGPDVVTERAERAAALETALSSLSLRQREVLQLVFYHGMTIEEAAAVMKISVGSARTHYARGKQALAQRISQVDVP